MTYGRSAVDIDYRRWLDQLAVARRGSRIGTAALIDDASRARAAAAMSSGASVPLARPLTHPGFEVEVFYTDGPIGMGSDQVELDCHGRSNTHLDALNHISIGGTGTRDGRSTMSMARPSVISRRTASFTRGVFVDVPKVRATPWVDAAEPVKADDIETAFATTGTRSSQGDALLLYMGRDRLRGRPATSCGAA